MIRLTLRATGLLSALALICASMLAPTSTAVAATTVETAASALGLASYSVTEVPGSGDITHALALAVGSAGSTDQARLVHLSAQQVSVTSTVRIADRVYIVADPGTTITWKGKDLNVLRFSPASGASLTGGVYGGIWKGAHRPSTTLISVSNAAVKLVELTVTEAGKHGIGAYDHSSLTLLNVTATDNELQGVYVEGSSRLDASGLHATGNRRNGVQISDGSSGTITGSWLDRNGQAVKGSTTGKVGHGLGVASGARVTVSGTSITRNKVCGVSLSGKAMATISGSHLDGNGRHGLGTTAGTRATLSDSTLNMNGYNGVLASGKGTQVTLKRVTISVAARSGVSVPSGGSATIAGSTITGGHKFDISVSTKGKLTLESGNTIGNARSHGITISGRSKITVTGPGNLVTGNHGDGLRITGSGTRGTIASPVSFRDNRHSAIVVASNAKLAMVPCAFSGNKKKVETSSGGKVTKL